MYGLFATGLHNCKEPVIDPGPANTSAKNTWISSQASTQGDTASVVQNVNVTVPAVRSSFDGI